MFTCSICGEKLDSDCHSFTYKTPCGHVFHRQCIITSLKRSSTCPMCCETVLKNELFKLFLQTDPQAEIELKEKTDEKIDTLNKKIKCLVKKESRHTRLVNNLETKLQLAKVTLDCYNEYNGLLQNEVQDQKKKNSNISAEKKLLHKKFDTSEVNKTKLRAETSLLKSIIKSNHYKIYNLQSVNSYTINRLKLELANLKLETANLKKRCYNIENNIDQPSTSKMNIENKNSVSIQNPTKSIYYEHDFQLHLSSKKFLFGCVFLFVDVSNQHEENGICTNTTISKVNVIKYGGSVQQCYSACVTHVICITQTHYIVERAIKEGKRCMTDYWLSDIIAKKSMIPPWLALHFPIPYSINSLPYQNLQFAIDNFDINENHIIKTMIELVGGKYIVKGITPKTNFLISSNLEGEIVKKALANDITVVNVQWLNDILFGAVQCINEPMKLKYQQFDLSNPFLVNYNMVSRLMDAWKYPLDIHINNLTFDSDSPSKFKRRKTISENPKMTNLIDGNNDVIISRINKKVSPNACVMLSGFTMNDVKILREMILSFGGTVANRCFEATHLIMKTHSTSTEFFGCISTVQYVLNQDWIKDSHSCLKCQDEKNYLIKTILHESIGLFSVPLILNNNMRHQLFRNIAFYVTPGIKCPTAPYMQEIISSAGGTVEKVRRKLKSLKKIAPNSYFIISCEEDHYLYNDLLDIQDVIYLPEFITSSILKQQLQLKKYLLKFTD